MASQQRAEAVIALIGEDGLSQLTAKIEKDFENIARKSKGLTAESGRYQKGLRSAAADSARLAEQTRLARASASRLADETRRAGESTSYVIGGWEASAMAANAVLGIAQKLTQTAKQIGAALAEGASDLAIDRAFASSVDNASMSIERLRDAVNFGVDDTSLQRIGIIASNSGLTIAQTAGMLEKANRLAMSTGGDLVTVAEGFSKAIATGRADTLKNLGVIVDFGAAVDDYAASVGRSAKDFSESEKAAARYTAVIEEADRVLTKVVIPHEQDVLNAAAADWANLWSGIKVGAAEASVAVFDVFRSPKAFVEYGKAVDGVSVNIDALVFASREAREAAGGVFAEGSAQYEQWSNAQENLTKLVKDDDKARKALVDRLRSEANALIALLPPTTDIATQEQTRLHIIRESAKELGVLSAAEAEYAKRMQQSAAQVRVAVSQSALLVAERIKLIEDEKTRREAKVSLRKLSEELSDFRDESNEIAAGLPASGGGGRGSGGSSRRRQADVPSPTGGRRGGIEGEDSLGRGGIESTVNGVDVDKVLSLLDSIDEAQRRVASSSVAMADSFISSFGSIGDAVGNASSIIVGQFEHISETVKMFEDAGKSAKDGYIKAVPGMLAAGGQLAAGFVENEQAKAAVMSLTETAASIASFATQDYFGGAMHASAAVMYGLVAGGAIGSSGGGGGAGRSLPARQTSIGPAQQAQQSSAMSITLNMGGATIIGGNRKSAGRDLVSLISEEMRSRGGSSGNFFAS